MRACLSMAHDAIPRSKPTITQVPRGQGANHNVAEVGSLFYVGKIHRTRRRKPDFGPAGMAALVGGDDHHEASMALSASWQVVYWLFVGLSDDRRLVVLRFVFAVFVFAVVVIVVGIPWRHHLDRVDRPTEALAGMCGHIGSCWTAAWAP
jgi:hypothetical protein